MEVVKRQTDLLELVGARRTAGRFTRPLDRRQQHRDQNGDDYDIMIRLDSASTPDINNINDLLVMANDGAFVPLKQLISTELQTVPSQLQHYYLERSASVTADTSAGFLTADVTAQVMKKLEQMQFPAGVSYRIGGEQESRDDSFSGLFQALLSLMRSSLLPGFPFWVESPKSPLSTRLILRLNPA